MQEFYYASSTSNYIRNFEWKIWWEIRAFTPVFNAIRLLRYFCLYILFWAFVNEILFQMELYLLAVRSVLIQAQDVNVCRSVVHDSFHLSSDLQSDLLSVMLQFRLTAAQNNHLRDERTTEIIYRKILAWHTGDDDLQQLSTTATTTTTTITTNLYSWGNYWFFQLLRSFPWKKSAL